MDKKRILIVKGDSSGCFPVPAVRGGAVQTLIEQIIAENEKEKKLEIHSVSFYDAQAERKALESYPHTKFFWIKPGKCAKFFDKLVYSLISKIRGTGKAKSVQSVFSGLSFIIGSTALLRKNEYDAVILQNYIPLAWVIRLSGYKGKFYFHLHNYPRTNACCKSVFRRCNGYICVSRYIADQIKSSDCKIGPIDEDKLFVLTNGIDVTVFGRAVPEEEKLRLREKFGIAENHKVVMFAGRISKEKGADLFVEALSKISYQPFTAMLVGGNNFSSALADDFELALQEKAKECNCRVVFTGFVPHCEMPEMYSLANVIVLPSTWGDPCPLSVCEAICSGVPLVTTVNGGIPELASGHATLLPLDDSIIDQLADTVSDVLHHPQVYRLNGNVLDSYYQSHSIQDYYRRFAALIHDLLS